MTFGGVSGALPLDVFVLLKSRSAWTVYHVHRNPPGVIFLEEQVCYLGLHHQRERPACHSGHPGGHLMESGLPCAYLDCHSVHSFRPETESATIFSSAVCTA